MTPLVLVVDASVAVKLYLTEALVAEAAALFDLLNEPGTGFHVPDLFYLECANIFWKQVQRGTCTPAQAATYLAKLVKLPLRVSDDKGLGEPALKLALDHNISAYDASYVALSQQKGVELITADQKLVTKLAGLTPAVVWLGDWKPPAATGTGTP
jgi:predicted nucleic acid-binding protein